MFLGPLTRRRGYGFSRGWMPLEHCYPQDQTKAPSMSDLSKPKQTLIDGMNAIFQKHEMQVISIVGLLVGYVCLFMTKILAQESILFGVSALILLVFLLLLSLSDADSGSPLFRGSWWLRFCTVCVVSLLLSAPQLHTAWTVAIQEKAAAEQLNLDRAVTRATQKRVGAQTEIQQPGNAR